MSTPAKPRPIAGVHYTPDVWLVPPMLADFECRHGRIGSCKPCERELRREARASGEAAIEHPKALDRAGLAQGDGSTTTPGASS